MFMYNIIRLDISTLEMISETIILWLIWFIHMSERYDNLEKTRFAWLTKKNEEISLWELQEIVHG